MSSATLIFVLEEIRKHREAIRGGRDKVEAADRAKDEARWVPALAFGPGLNVEGAMLRASF